MNLQNIQKRLAELETTAKQILIDISEENWKKEIIPGKWSMAEQLGHMLLSAYLITGVYKQPDEFFEKFGPVPPGEKSFDSLYENYLKKLAEGQRATPNSIARSEELLPLKDGLQAWLMVCEKLNKRIDEHWNEKRLDQFMVPHPALDLITTRELLFFQIFHSNHHFEQIKALKKLC